MKKLIMGIFLCATLCIGAQVRTDNKRVDLSVNYSLLQKKETNKDGDVMWYLSLLDNRRKTNTTLDRIEMPKPSYLFDENKFLHIIPELIDVVYENNNLYAFVFVYESVYMYNYGLTESSRNPDLTLKQRYAITERMTGSVMNFGGYIYQICKEKVGDDYYLCLHYGRQVAGQHKELYHLNTRIGKLSKLQFSENTVSLQDKQALFETINLKENKDKIGAEIKRKMIQSSHLGSFAKFEYLGCMEDAEASEQYKRDKKRECGNIYFFYKESPLSDTKIVRYNLGLNEWNISDYKLFDGKSTLKVGLF